MAMGKESNAYVFGEVVLYCIEEGMLAVGRKEWNARTCLPEELHNVLSMLVMRCNTYYE